MSLLKNAIQGLKETTTISGTTFKVDCWLKNNTEWYYPQKDVDLSGYDHIDVLSLSNYGDLFYAYNNGQKEHGRLFRGKITGRTTV